MSVWGDKEALWGRGACWGAGGEMDRAMARPVAWGWAPGDSLGSCWVHLMWPSAASRGSSGIDVAQAQRRHPKGSAAQAHPDQSQSCRGLGTLLPTPRGRKRGMKVLSGWMKILSNLLWAAGGGT